MLRASLLAGAKAASLVAASKSPHFLGSSLSAGTAVAAQHSWHKLWSIPTPHEGQFRSFAAAAQPEPVRQDDEEHIAHEEAPTGHKMPTYADGYVAPHGSMKTTMNVPEMLPVDVYNVMNQPVYSMDYMESIKPKHLEPQLFSQKLAYHAIQTVRKTFDWVTGYSKEGMTEEKWLQRMLFLETVAGVPGMVGGMLRHLKSLRTMEPDHGWINTLLDEAENERLHLLTFMQMREPGLMFRAMVILAQGVFFNAFFLAYLVSPKTCHAAVGYLEEEAVKTYTHALKDIDEGRLWAGKKAPGIARTYWKLPEDATMRELILAIRADEACHSHVNHTFSRIKQTASNPFGAQGHSALP